MSGREEAGKASSGGPAGKAEGRPPDSRQGKASEEGNGKMVGPRVGEKNPSSRATEVRERVPRTKLFPRKIKGGKRPPVNSRILDMLARL